MKGFEKISLFICPREFTILVNPIIRVCNSHFPSKILFIPSILLILFQACSPTPPSTHFSSLTAEKTNIHFENTLEYSEEFNMYTYRNFYNGGGVAIGDINKDGLADIFFCGNMVDNKLYLNKGNFQFEDITEQAGVASENVWSTGVSFADVNGDGWLDMYVCKSGRPGGDKRHNELFISKGVDENGIPSFEEKAKDYGIADMGLSSHAAFFDYDKDGDLDCYLLNNSFRPVGGFDMQPGLRDIRDSLGGNKLYRNDLINSDGEDSGEVKFTDVSEYAGIYGSAIGFGLGVTIGDVNRDGWQDIFVSNDFFEHDYLYINQQNGTFKEDLKSQMGETSMGSMGADMADINNDGLPEIFVTEMLPVTEERYKTKMTFENWDKYQLNVKSGYHHQFTRNVLQLNNGNNTFSEIGRMANVHATDWSWSALMADFDNDGLKDIYISNGIYKDLLDQDYINFHSNDPGIIQSIKNKEPGAILKLIDIIPSERIPNMVFRNKGNLTFEEANESWNMDMPSHSNGSAYGDLDNDGDLDLVVNNVNMPPFVLRNESPQDGQHNYLQVSLEGAGNNAFGLGAQVSIMHKGKTYFQELAPMRGFQSSIDYTLHFGLGDIDTVEQLKVKWPNGAAQTLRNLKTNQRIDLQLSQVQLQEDAATQSLDSSRASSSQDSQSIFRDISSQFAFDFTHSENDFVDFNRDRLIYHMLSREGPRMAVGDVNGDGLEDIYVCGAAKQLGVILAQTPEGGFEAIYQAWIGEDRFAEDTNCLFADFDGDGDLDLYVTSGGNEFDLRSNNLRDRLYFNTGHGVFEKSAQLLPTEKRESTSALSAADFDGDGDVDLFVGIRSKPGVYGVPVGGFLLENDGKGTLTNVTETIAPELKGLGQLTDATWADIDGDQDQDLIIVGEWMPITVFRNDGRTFNKITNKAGFEGSNGLWQRVVAADLDQDGDMDFVLTNHGLNTRFKASPEKPLRIYVNDFDKNRTAEQIITMYNGEEDYPLALRHDLTMQMPGLKKKYLLYENYKGQRMEDIFEDKQIRTSAQAEVYTTASAIAWNDGSGKFSLEPLPIEAQMSPLYAIQVDDFDEDGHPDILLGGNFYHSKPEVGIYDATYGVFLKGDGNKGFTALSAQSSGFFVKGEIRDFAKAKVGEKELIVVARNDEGLMFFE